MKKKTPHLDLYKKWLSEKRMNIIFNNIEQSTTGLCWAAYLGAIDHKRLNLFIPTYEDKEQLRKEDKDTLFWGSDSFLELHGKFTKLRQTILLFIAAMNNEL